MLKRKTDFIDDVLFGNPVSIPKEYKEELRGEVLRTNINREKILSYVLILINIIMICINNFATNVYRLDRNIFSKFAIFHMILLFGSLLFLYLVHLIEKRAVKNTRLIGLVHISLDLLVLTIYSLITISAGTVTLPPFTYIMAAVSIGSLILLSPLERHIVFILPCIVDIICIICAYTDVSLRIQNIFFFIIFTLLSMVISCINYDLHSKNFVSNKMVIKKNEEIDKLYRTTKDLLNKRTDELNEAMEYEKVRTAFFANISHELRTPLNIIFSAEQMLDILFRESRNYSSNNEQINQYMTMMKQNCYRLIRLINNLIDITKIDAGYFTVNLVNCDIVKVVEDIICSVAKYVDDRNINLIFDTEIEEKVIACDPDNIERIILNLLSNAIKFTPEGGEIKVYIYQKDDKVVISVKDTGIGIPEEMKQLIFERFVQVDKTTTRKREGSGIGLSIVKSLVDLQGGSISLHTKQGEGSEFVITLPDVLIDNDEFVYGNNAFGCNETSENINIEFSDIY